MPIQSELIIKLAAVIMLALTPYACMQGLDRQAQADYEQCLSWQADGYPVECDVEKYR